MSRQRHADVSGNRTASAGSRSTAAKRDITQRFVYPDDAVIDQPFDWGQMRRLLGYMAPYKRRVTIVLLITMVGTAANLMVPLIIRHAIDFGMTENNYDTLLRTVGLLAFCFFVWWISTGIRIQMSNWIGQHVLRDMREGLFRHVQYLSFNFFDERSAGSILVRIINDVNSLQELFTNGVVNVVMDVLILTGIVGIMLSIHVKLALATMVVVPIMMVLSTKLRREIRLAWRQVRMRLARINSHLNEAIQGMRVTQAFVQENANSTYFDHINDDYRRSMNRSSKVSDLFTPVVELTGAVGTAIVYWYGGRTVIGDEITLGLFIAFVYYLGRFWEPISRLGRLYNQVLAAMSSSERIFEFLDTHPTVMEKGGAKALPPIEGDIRFEGVSFSYRPDRPALHGVNLHIRPGETVALVGPTGSGKSTIVNLVCRFYDATEGQVLIDGHDVRDVQIESLRSQIGIVLQDTFLFSGTLADNIRFGNLDASMDDVREACRAVGADAFIEKLPDGYDTVVSERGSGLSVGQRQLISFARALLADPAVLILDEATASVDTETEIHIQQALETLLQGRTSIVVAHRLSTIRNADRIVVLEQGQVESIGNHEQLMQKGDGLYRDLVEAQFKFVTEAS